ncbi:ubiquitin carboxyl-terminal hydrolase 16 [Nymphaea colorata]|nr:ubiquitin carboxyl-terminal hydrolase 16 [Nymphaea colorata]
MPGNGDLGLPGFLLVLVVVPFVSFLVRRKWRQAEARKQEIRRLLILASEESARAELTAALEYRASSSLAFSPPPPIATTFTVNAVPAVAFSSSFSSSPSLSTNTATTTSSSSVASSAAAANVCAVCFEPTSTRCSRCKAVRYCSGKCQIIHWRQGHKEECCPPKTITSSNIDPGVPQKNVASECPTLKDDNDRSESSRLSNSVEPSLQEVGSSATSVRQDKDAAPLADSSGEAADSAISLSRCNRDTDLSTYDSDSVSPIIHSSLRPKVPISSGIASLSPLKAPNGNEENGSDDSSSGSADLMSVAKVNDNVPSSGKFIRQSAEINGVSTQCTKSASCAVSENVIGSTAGVAPQASEAVRDPIESFQTSDGGKPIQPSSSNIRDSSGCSPSPLLYTSDNPVSVKLSRSSSTPKCRPSDHTLYKHSMKGMPGSGVALNNFITENTKPKDSLEDQGKLQPRSSQAVVDKISSKSSTWRSTAQVAPVGNLPSIDPGRSASRATPEKSTNASEPTISRTVRKVVQQFRGPKRSKQNSVESGNEIAGKPKVILSYDLFVKLYNEKVELYPFGLSNCGNSCYANAVLQCLAFTPPLTAYLLQGLHTKKCKRAEGCFTCEFERLILQSKEGKFPLSPIKILSQMHSIGSHLGYGKEEDAHEFLRYAIDAMQSENLAEVGGNVSASFIEEATLLQLTFGGYLLSYIKCLKCHGRSVRREKMMDLTVEIDGNIGTLEEALKQFTAPEILDGDNKYLCERCKAYVRARKRLKVFEAPNVLTIVLKRFQSGKFGKINKPVHFPEELDLTPYMSEQDIRLPSYKLYGVVVHLDVMNASFSGHYVCYVKAKHDKWYKIDDSKVKPVELDRVLSKGAYMLLYARSSPCLPNSIRHVMNRSRKNDAGLLNRSSSTPRSRSDNISATTGWLHDHVHKTDDALRSESFSSFDAGTFGRPPGTDSSSDNSSLFSCSDEASCSTESTRDSTSTDEYSYIFGEPGRYSWSSPANISEGSPVGCSHSMAGGSNGEDHEQDYLSMDFIFPNHRSSSERLNYDKIARAGKRESWAREEGPTFLYSDPTNLCSSSSSSYNYSSGEIGSEMLGTAHGDEGTHRIRARWSRERTANKFL